MNTAELDRLKSLLDEHRPLPAAVVANLQENLRVRWTYNSNAIEGSTLTLQETKVVLEGITVGGRTLREHLEAVNHAEAIDLICSMATAEGRLTERELKDIHALVLKGIDPENAGRFRRVNVTIAGAQHVPPSFLHLDQEMANLFAAYTQCDLHSTERAARLHVDFVKIHPFVDGNGRTARLIMNLELIRGGFPPVVIAMADRLEYYQALDRAHVHNDYDPFFELTERLVVESFNPYWFALGLDEQVIQAADQHSSGLSM